MKNRAMEYFHVAKIEDALWHWDAESGNILWVDGSLIATREEILAILYRLAPDGLPRFGALVLLLASLRERYFTLWWSRPSDDEHENRRVPSLIKARDFESIEIQRILLIAEPETLSRVVQGLMKMNHLTYAYKDLLTIRSISNLARVLLNVPSNSSNPEALVTLLADRKLDFKKLNHPDWGTKYSGTFHDLAAFIPKLELLRDKDAILQMLKQTDDNPTRPG